MTLTITLHHYDDCNWSSSEHEGCALVSTAGKCVTSYSVSLEPVVPCLALVLHAIVTLLLLRTVEVENACMYTYSTLFNRLTHSACALSVLLPLASSVSPLPPRLRRPRLRRPRLSPLSSSCPPVPASSPLTRHLGLPTGFRCLSIALNTRLMMCVCPCLRLSML